MKPLRILTTVTVLFLTLTGTTFAAFEIWGASVRAKGMADAMAAYGGDINALPHNPAGLAALDTLQVNVQYDLPFTGLDDVSIGVFNASYAAPFVNDGLINWPASIINLLTFGLTRPVFQDGAYGLSFYTLSDELYYERAISMAFGRRLSNILNTGLNFSVGFRMNILMRGVNDNEYTAVNPYFANGTSTSAFGLDLGVIMYLSKSVHIGLVFNNFIEPDIAINADTEEPLNSSIKAGVNWEVGDLLFMQDLKIAYTYTSLGRDEDDIRTAKTVNGFGFEFWQLSHSFAFRSGFEWGDDLSNLSLGISYILGLGSHAFTFDYAFILPLDMKATSGTHMLSLTWALDLPKSAFEFDDKKQAEMRRLEDLADKTGGETSTTSTNNKPK